ncbi:single-stranded-DNA-specific exonuclease RecJ [Sediminispirochaeta bajacaliforniensis]|uniref:single-stranded-DNA-specific exonuclease RecJ n=1 Tax=Sediminispirochaeta bajacaliforniensis TaxID=148 RepID=UPI00037761AD|nr:single-stranded-DNA-specific exonuclease RecJ [Sediminispirochaeta bajacaliforniensis]
MIWKKSDIDPEVVRDLSRRYGIDLLIASIMARRGVLSPDDVKFHIEEELSFTHNPFLFDEMTEVVDRLFIALDEGEKLRIFGDRDVDGITSTVLMKQQLEGMGLEVSWSLPKGDDPYGLTMEIIDLMERNEETLLITVDCGISNYREIAYAREKGIDTLIIDHHNPSEELPCALAIINPKIADCGYPFSGLAAVGVVSKVIWALEFAKTDFYKEEIVLLNVRPGNETVIFEAVKLENLVEQDRIVENLVPNIVRFDQTRLADFLVGKQILVYDEQSQIALMKKLFGPNVDIGVVDVAPEIWKSFPKTKGESLLRLRERSRSNRYEGEKKGEIDTFLSIFNAWIMKRYEYLSGAYESILDLVALGTLADMMPLEDENRILVKRGMKLLSEARRGGVQELLVRQNLLGKRLSTTDVGWQISPIINATGRLGVPEKAADLLLETDAMKRAALADEVVSLNRKRKKLGETAWKTVVPLAKKSLTQYGERFILVEDKSFHRGITGILASRLVQSFGVPSAVIAHLDTHLVGSIRSVKGINAKTFLESFSDLLLDFGGHDLAAGFSLTFENFPSFLQRFTEMVERMEVPQNEEEAIQIDAELPPSYMKPELCDIVERFEPYGEKSPPLVFMAKRVRLAEISLIGKPDPIHLKLLVDSGSFKWPAVFWRSADRVGVDFQQGDQVDILFRLGRNYFQNREQPQLTILDVRQAAI